MASDLEQLIEMGFDPDRAKIAVNKTGGLLPAIEWLDANSDKSLDEIQATTTTQPATDDTDEPPALQPGEVPRSLVCGDCGKKFRSQGQAEFHASKTEHVNFSESTEEIAPLTEEEKAARLVELRKKLEVKRAQHAEEEKTERKRNEQIRRKSTKETMDLKEDVQKKEHLKELAQKRRDKKEAIEAKERIKAKIEADKIARREKAEREKAEREGRAILPVKAAPAPTPTPPAPEPVSMNTEVTLRLQGGNVTLDERFPVDTTLSMVADSFAEKSKMEVNSLTRRMPRQIFDTTSFEKTLKDVGITTNEFLIVG
ncbi:hypothetical protein FQN52_001148 [Onygenales sp. PD_12]|nr:hypothetical protein FQN53_006614 [Emmonsiellopsis sp. PD_33]KAK2793562.1 hypothetical protein FQN52_001148 [Onygenales sp. PD_12]